ncbi:MAG: outer membrane protein assembly factor BamC [Halomonas sp. HL-48]|nr:outer membrane protein assembly factor BamC [Halomonas sp. HL-48]KPQ26340.1 MAG: outer membrane protein assembly factor BamC [Halomonas sp. HL-48]
MSSVFEQRALKWIPLAVVAAATLAGCARDEGFYHDRNLDYVNAEPASPLVLPDTRNTERYRDALPVPEASSQRAQDDVAEVRPPQPLTIGGVQADYVETREIGDQRWLVVDADPGSVWTQLESFVRQRGMNVQESRASEGVLVTSQAEFRLQSALREGSTEVRCERGGQSMTSCLDAMEDYFANSASSSQTESSSASSWNAQRLDNDESIAIRQEGDAWEIEIPYDADRVWAEIHHYLTQDFDREGERDLLSADPDSHAFLVEYMTERERNRNPLQIMFSPDVRRMSQEIQLDITSQGDQSVLKAVNASEREFTPDDQRELLERIASYLR